MLLTDLEKKLEQMRVRQKYRLKSRLIFFVVCLLIIVIGLGLYHAYKPMPSGLDFAGPSYTVNESDIQFLFDRNFTDETGFHSEQEIFGTVFKYIDQADQYILLDMFLFNDWQGSVQPQRKLAKELTDHLLAKKQANPDLKIDIITDPINTVYGGASSAYLNSLEQAGITVITTDLRPLPDSNPWYSAWWRTLFVWFGNSSDHGWLPNPFDVAAAKVSLRSYLAMLNFKANHRKLMIADNNGQLVTVIGSANPHDASSANSNAAVAIRGPLAESVYQSEAAVAGMSNRALYSLPQNLINQALPPANKYAKVSMVTENQIKQAILNAINKLQAGDEIKIAMFYLSDKDIRRVLLAGAKQGIEIKLILDANQDAFGYRKPGIPNLAVAQALTNESNGAIKIRWAIGQGEQFHDKMFMATDKVDKQMIVLIGSANLTRRNLDNYNLEADVLLTLNTDWDLAKQVNDYFDKLWSGSDGRVYSVDYRLYADTPWWLPALTWFQETSGLSSF